MNRIEYAKGDKVGVFEFVKNVEPIITKSKRVRRCVQLKCPHCNAVFTGVIDTLKYKQRSCGCKQWAGKHGKWGIRLYSIWDGMKQRCLNPNSKVFHRYGGRGIKVYKEWQEFLPFYDWAMANGYQEDLTLDRKDNDLGYSPDNCRWVNRHVQQCNRNNIESSSSKYIGVSLRKDTKKWTSYMTAYGKRVRFGSFEDEKEAAIARDNYIIENNLTEYKLNFKNEDYGKKFSKISSSVARVRGTGI